MTSVREALETVLRETAPLGTERVGLLESAGRVLAETIRSQRDVPGYANSAMDGYAVRFTDVERCPARLPVTGVASAGGAVPEIGPGEASKVMTGAPIPRGADTVVRVEDTRSEGESVVIERHGPKGAHIRLPGEDIRRGDVVLEPRRVLSPADVGLLASIGRTVLLVHQRPRVAILSTGNELVEADDPISPGQVVNSNAYTLTAAVEEAGGIAVPLPVARDTLDAIRSAFTEAARCDAILSTGGVSVGEFDYVKQVMDEVGVRRFFWKVAQKPGKPLTFGILSGRPYFGLPGNPVSSLVCFYLYARPALLRMMGHTAVHLPAIDARVGETIRKAEGLVEFVRCRLERQEGAWHAFSTGSQSSGVLRSMSEGDGLIVAPAERSVLEPGTGVRVVLLTTRGGSVEPPF